MIQKSWNFIEKKKFFLVQKVKISPKKKNFFFDSKKLKFHWKKKKIWIQKSWNFVEKKLFWVDNFVEKKLFFFGSKKLKFRWKNKQKFLVQKVIISLKKKIFFFI